MKNLLLLSTMLIMLISCEKEESTFQINCDFIKKEVYSHVFISESGKQFSVNKEGAINAWDPVTHKQFTSIWNFHENAVECEMFQRKDDGITYFIGGTTQLNEEHLIQISTCSSDLKTEYLKEIYYRQ